MAGPPVSDLLTLTQASRELRVERWKVARLIRRNLFAARRLDHLHVVPRRDLPALKECLRRHGYLPTGEPAGAGGT